MVEMDFTDMAKLLNDHQMATPVHGPDASPPVFHARIVRLDEGGTPWIADDIWTDIWRNHPIARTALAAAFAGESQDFRVSLADSFWDNRVQPVDWTDGEVSSVLAVSVMAPPVLTVDLTEMREAIHVLSNLSSVSAAASRLLSRGIPDAAVDIAGALDQSSQRAFVALDLLRTAVNARIIS